MPQDTLINPTAVTFCRFRVTRLNADGTVASAPNNMAVSDKVLTLATDPQYDEGDRKTLDNGCGQRIFDYKDFDKVSGWNFTLARGTLAPWMEEMMVGGAVILDTSTVPVVVGKNFPTIADAQPPVAIEAWAKAWLGDHQSTTHPYIRFVWPMTYWRMAGRTVENDPMQANLEGWTQGNAAWGIGPYTTNAPQPYAVGSQGGYVWEPSSFTLPAATLGYGTVA